MCLYRNLISVNIRIFQFLNVLKYNFLKTFFRSFTTVTVQRQVKRKICLHQSNLFKKYANIWRSLQTYGGVCKHMEESENIWRSLQTYGGVWKHMDWRSLKTYGGVWKHIFLDLSHFQNEPQGFGIFSLNFRFD